MLYDEDEFGLCPNCEVQAMELTDHGFCDDRTYYNEYHCNNCGKDIDEYIGFDFIETEIRSSTVIVNESRSKPLF